MKNAKSTVEYVLSLADIKINGSRPQDIVVKDERFYKKALTQRNLGLGEAYMDGWWEANQLDAFFTNILKTNIRDKVKITPSLVKTALVSVLTNRQTTRRAKHNAKHHYNIGNELYRLMLDKRMVYSCAYWEAAKDLDAAQEAKLDLICRKLQLQKGMTVLDIGCGWGGFAEYAASKYGADVTGISPAEEQVQVARERTKGLKVKILQSDYREVAGTYDRVISVGMLEHVGPKNYKTFFQKCSSLLKDDGIMLHHTIGANNSHVSTDPWMDKYIFPGGVIPSLAQISKSVERKLIIEDVHNFGPYYDKTLMAWYKNFNKNFKAISSKYDDRFRRMWDYYLLSCAAAFRTRNLQLWQIVMRKDASSEVYKSVR